MERVLERILKESSPTKHPLLRITCKETIDFLENQQGFIRGTPCELREKCLEVLRLALETKSNKMVSHALTGFQKMIRDNSFNSLAFEKSVKDSEEKLLPYQVLQSIMCLPSLPDDIQVEFLKLLISISCTNNWSLTKKSVLWTTQLCAELYSTGSQQVKTAATATASQTLSSYCLFLQDEILSKGDKNVTSDGRIKNEDDLLRLFEKIQPILLELCNKISKRTKSKNGRKPTAIILECILALLSSISAENLEKAPEFVDFIWQELCPTLIIVLSSPLNDKNGLTCQPHVQRKAMSSEEVGRGSACLTTSASFRSVHVKIVYSITAELVKLIGPMPALRPVLESLFHRILLYPPPQYRLEALKIFREKLLKKPDRIINLLLPSQVDEAKNAHYDDMSLIKLLMDAAHQCCRCEDLPTCYASIDCIVSMLSSLEELCMGKGLHTNHVHTINTCFPELEDSDYKLTAKQTTNPEDVEEVTAHGYDAQDEFSSDGSDRLSIHKRYRKTLADSIKNFTSSEDDDDFDRVQDVNVEVHNKSDEDVLDVEDVKEAIDENNVNENEEIIQQDIGYNTDSSGITEGPEEGFDDELDVENNEEKLEERRKAEETAARLDKVPKTLLGNESGKTEREKINELCLVRNELAEKEKQSARHFATTLQELLPLILNIKGSIAVDMALQEFASTYCDGVWNNKPNEIANDEDTNISLLNIVIMNADGIYLAIHSALLLNLKLLRNSCYSDASKTIPVTEEQFIEEVHGSGVLVYLSAVWLSHVYQIILKENLLGKSGYNPVSMENCSLINLLTDIDGLGSNHQGDQLLFDYQRLEKATGTIYKSPEVEAGQKISRRVLMACWDNLLTVLSSLLNSKSSYGTTISISLMLGADCAKEEQRRAQDAIAMSLDGLQKAARLSNMLGLQSLCSAVFSQLAIASCLEDSCKTIPTSGVTKYLRAPSILSILKTKSIRLHSSYVLSMDVILGRGLELSSHSPDGWKHVFRCCIYVAELEHKFFSKNRNSNPSKLQPHMKTKVDIANNDNLTFALDPQEYAQPLPNARHYPAMPTTLMAPSMHIPDLVKEAELSGGSGMLNTDQVAKILCCLSQHIDRLYENAATKLNLSALLAFLAELCSVSQAQLFPQGSKDSLASNSTYNHNDRKENTLLLYRLGEVMLKCVRSGRPLLHMMKAWSVVAPHFVEAACHKDNSISKKAVSCIHDIVNALMSAQTELPHFHFNEALFKPFENLLTLELCDADIQDQIVSSICEFIEGSTADIRSGWRPLFGALRAVQVPSVQLMSSLSDEDKDKAGHMRAVLDVFEAFLHTENVFVFANAAVDCVLCLLKHVRGPTELQDNNQDSSSTDNQSVDLCVAALNYLYQFSSILTSMYKMPACPVFHSANRIKLNTRPHFVDQVIPGMKLIPFKDAELNKISDFADEEQVEKPKMCDTVTLEQLDNHTSILHVWFLLLEGLAGAIATCPKKYQPHTMETLFSLMKEVFVVPGPDFAIYCVNHLLLPMLQGWIRRTSRIYRGWDNFASNFKQCCGLATDLVVEYINKLDGNSEVKGVSLMLEQLFAVMNECIAQPTETISRLGCACIRHAISSLGDVMTPNLWTTTCNSLRRATTITLHSINQLMVCFQTNSDNFYGDFGTVKVATRRDCLISESVRLKQLAHQVFLLDTQRQNGKNYCIVSDDVRTAQDEDRSFIFLLHPPNMENTLNPDMYIVRVPFRNIVVGLLCHQLILQTIGSMLLQGTDHAIPTLAGVLASSSSEEKEKHGKKLPGVMSKLDEGHLKVLMECLSTSYDVACKFDSRPGLKFLVQKVADAQVAANLFKQAGVAWTIQTVVLFELCLNTDSNSWSVEGVKKILLEHRSRERKTVCYDDSKIGASADGCISHPLVSLQERLVSFCDDYIDLILDKDGRLFNADSIADQPIFFLTAPQDDFPFSETIARETKSMLSSSRQNSVESESDAKSEVSGGKSPNRKGSVVEDSQVYTVATEKTIQNLMTEYKKRKQQRAMPTRESTNKNPKEDSESKNSEPVSEEIDTQRRSSIMKDGEARLEVFTEMILSALELLHQLEDTDFEPFLPLVFPAVSSLLLYGSDPHLRSCLVDWLSRISKLYKFSPSESLP